MQLVEWIRGSSSKTSTLLRQSASSSATFGSGRNFGLSAKAWKILIQQAWLSGFLHRDMKRGVGKMLSSGVIFNVYSISSVGEEFLENPKELMLPIMDAKPPTKVPQKDEESESLSLPAKEQDHKHYLWSEGWCALQLSGSQSPHPKITIFQVCFKPLCLLVWVIAQTYGS